MHGAAATIGRNAGVHCLHSPLISGAQVLLSELGPMLIAVLVGSEKNLGPIWGIFSLRPSEVILGFFVGALVGHKNIRSK